MKMTLQELMEGVEEIISNSNEPNDELEEEEQAILFMIGTMFPRDFVFRKFLVSYVNCHAFLHSKNLDGLFALYLLDAANKFCKELEG